MSPCFLRGQPALELYTSIGRDDLTSSFFNMPFTTAMGTSEATNPTTPAEDVIFVPDLLYLVRVTLDTVGE